ncbi:Mur ligase domain-containing protein [Paenibacillus solisilvae]|uniref:Mur ligase domain-containing protein n=1 Tax=Paenibacillus solisilvae TaxID=2486751 RepID=A0ABW0W2Q0_9BACL
MTGGILQLQGHARDCEIKGVSIDSRTIKPGSLFIPLVRIMDGHHYFDEAINKGAAASLWQADHPNPPRDIPFILVEDCLEAMQSLAGAYRQECRVKIVGITGKPVYIGVKMNCFVFG